MQRVWNIIWMMLFSEALDSRGLGSHLTCDARWWSGGLWIPKSSSLIVYQWGISTWSDSPRTMLRFGAVLISAPFPADLSHIFKQKKKKTRKKNMCPLVGKVLPLTLQKPSAVLFSRLQPETFTFFTLTEFGVKGSKWFRQYCSIQVQAQCVYACHTLTVIYSLQLARV